VGKNGVACEIGRPDVDPDGPLVVMYGARSWAVAPGETFTFGRGKTCSAVLSADDRGVSRRAGSLRHHDGAWWIHNDSRACLLYVTGDRGFRADIPPGMRLPLQQWHAKIRLAGGLGTYTLLVRLPELDHQPDGPDGPDAGGQAGADGSADRQASTLPGKPDHTGTGPDAPVPLRRPDERATSTTEFRPPLTESDRLVLAARFERYLTWRYPGAPTPCTAREAAERIGWKPHAVVKRCENIRERYARHGAPGLRGPRALEELAALLTSTGELTADDLRRLPARSHSV
jgi:hypothetical protein